MIAMRSLDFPQANHGHSFQVHALIQHVPGNFRADRCEAHLTHTTIVEELKSLCSDLREAESTEIANSLISSTSTSTHPNGIADTSVRQEQSGERFVDYLIMY
jgi:hypothetical protein